MQIAAVGDGNAHTQTQGIEDLSQSGADRMDAEVIQLWRKDKGQPGGSARQGESAHNDNQQNHKKSGHHEFARFFNAADTEIADQGSGKHKKKEPDERLCRMTDEGGKILWRPCGKGIAEEIFDNPAADHCIVGQDKEGCQNAEITDDPCMRMDAVIGQNRIMAGLAPQRHLGDHDRNAQKPDKDQIGSQKRKAAVASHEIGKFP